ncbi:uncharacterized protein SCODWIG_01908 [Saccharomycodes ludwigii]|uniref:Meiotically up-regulated protein Msb1/Mug8 domain-containing protein n=1 Tax=Saccharomycodes ludwigii TaxID=36035 RepID=A0A376B618_9ASCO|nr:uncharacterized protein SCODWIG_01908 [Saccharomycodes ludwigii]
MVDTNKPLPSTEKLTKKKNPNNLNLEDDEDDEFEFFHEFKPSNVKSLVHIITTQLKASLDIEYLFLPFRKEQTNENLLKFLNSIFPLGNGVPLSNDAKILKIVQKTTPDTLFQTLKYIWCRLPNGEIIGWEAYNKFLKKEKKMHYPQRAFLEIMPKCLKSPDHASLVYDFFDLLVAFASNSKINKLSARKISRMCAIWAFSCEAQNITNGSNQHQQHQSSAKSLDFSSAQLQDIKKLGNNSYEQGLAEWLPASNAVFHLTMAFIKSFLPPEKESSHKPMDNLPLDFPKSLRHVLYDNEYPPNSNSWYTGSSTILTVPLVTLKTTKFSKKPWSLFERCGNCLNFDNPNDFGTREDYAILKSLFNNKKRDTVEAVSKKMSKQSKKLMKEMTTKHSTFQAGWAKKRCVPPLKKVNVKDEIEIKRVDIDDYFIWTWMSSISNEQTSFKKKIFGRSLISEFEFDGFKKWVIIEESDKTLDYITRLNATSSANNLTLNGTKEKKNSAIDKIHDTAKGDKRNATPVYEKFQKLNMEKSMTHIPRSKNFEPELGPQLRKQHKAETSVHSIEHKLAKWNPLNNLRKKSETSITSLEPSPDVASDAYLEERGESLLSPAKQTTAFNKNNGDLSDLKDSNRITPSLEQKTNMLQQPSIHEQSKNSDRVISSFSLLKPGEYELPPLELGDDNFAIDLPILDAIQVEDEDIRKYELEREQRQLEKNRLQEEEEKKRLHEEEQKQKTLLAKLQKKQIEQQRQQNQAMKEEEPPYEKDSRHNERFTAKNNSGTIDRQVEVIDLEADDLSDAVDDLTSQIYQFDRNLTQKRQNTPHYKPEEEIRVTSSRYDSNTIVTQNSEEEQGGNETNSLIKPLNLGSVESLSYLVNDDAGENCRVAMPQQQQHEQYQYPNDQYPNAAKNRDFYAQQQSERRGRSHDNHMDYALNELNSESPLRITHRPPSPVSNPYKKDQFSEQYSYTGDHPPIASASPMNTYQKGSPKFMQQHTLNSEHPRSPSDRKSVV